MFYDSDEGLPDGLDGLTPDEVKHVKNAVAEGLDEKVIVIPEEIKLEEGVMRYICDEIREYRDTIGGNPEDFPVVSLVILPKIGSSTLMVLMDNILYRYEDENLGVGKSDVIKMALTLRNDKLPPDFNDNEELQAKLTEMIKNNSGFTLEVKPAAIVAEVGEEKEPLDNRVLGLGK